LGWERERENEEENSSRPLQLIQTGKNSNSKQAGLVSFLQTPHTPEQEHV